MRIIITKSQELANLQSETGVEINDNQNGGIDIVTKFGDPNPRKTIFDAVSAISSDNPELTLVQLNVVTNPDGTFGAIAIFVSFTEIGFMLQDPVSYLHTHGLSHVCPPFR
jgi:hypothetical protein